MEITPTQPPLLEPVEFEPTREERELKYAVDPTQLPADLLEALEEGTKHPDILRRGRLTQLYLPVTRKTLALAVKCIQDVAQANHNPIDPSIIAYFSDPDNVSEIRILRREQDHLGDPSDAYQQETASAESALIQPDTFQITIKGRDQENGDKRSVLETKISDDRVIAQGVVLLLESLRQKDADGRPKKLTWKKRVKKLEKMWYDLRIPNPFQEGEYFTVELDIFPDLEYFAMAEIEFEGDDAREQMNRFRDDYLPPWFHTELTGNSNFRSKELACLNERELPDELADVIDELRDKLRRMYLPTILGNQIFLDENSEGKRFAMLGSFKRFLPQFARIGDDLRRQAESVFPNISTLDIARRRLSDENDEGDSFRIEELEDEPLSTAELGYLREIKKADAVYVVCPDGRMGGTSTQETVYALGLGKSVFFATRPERISRGVPLAVLALVEAVHSQVFFRLKDHGEVDEGLQRQDFDFQNRDFSHAIQVAAASLYGDDSDTVRRVLRYNLRSCLLEISRWERAEAKKAAEQERKAQQLTF